jgi:hypothetical protein
MACMLQINVVVIATSTIIKTKILAGSNSSADFRNVYREQVVQLCKASSRVVQYLAVANGSRTVPICTVLNLSPHLLCLSPAMYNIMYDCAPS